NARLAAFLASDAFANEFTQNTPALVAALRAGGIEAVRGLIAAQREEAQTGVPGAVQEFVDTWNATYANNQIEMPVNANTAPAQSQLDNFVYRGSSRVIEVTVKARRSGGGNFATGGHVRGAGTSTSDSIPAWLSD